MIRFCVGHSGFFIKSSNFLILHSAPPSSHLEGINCTRIALNSNSSQVFQSLNIFTCVPDLKTVSFSLCL